MKLFNAIIWDENGDLPGKRVGIWANSLGEAKSAIESEYGPNRVYTLHNEEDANRVRSPLHASDLAADGISGR